MVALGDRRRALKGLKSMSTPEDTAPEAEPEVPHVAKVGVVDRGHNVTGFGGEPISGMIADLADGDD